LGFNINNDVVSNTYNKQKAFIHHHSESDHSNNEVNKVYGDNNKVSGDNNYNNKFSGDNINFDIFCLNDFIPWEEK